MNRQNGAHVMTANIDRELNAAELSQSNELRDELTTNELAQVSGGMVCEYATPFAAEILATVLKVK
jgi:bacteriocin-like protein